MYLTPEKTRELAIKFGGNENNTGDTAVQIAILTERILHLTDLSISSEYFSQYSSIESNISSVSINLRTLSSNITLYLISLTGISISPSTLSSNETRISKKDHHNL